LGVRIFTFPWSDVSNQYYFQPAILFGSKSNSKVSLLEIMSHMECSALAVHLCAFNRFRHSWFHRLLVRALHLNAGLFLQKGEIQRGKGIWYTALDEEQTVSPGYI